MSDQSANEQQADLAQDILNRILTDAEFRQQLLNNPAETLTQAGYIEGDDVSGYMLAGKGNALTIIYPSGPTAGKPGIGTTAITCPPSGGGGSVTGKPNPPANL